MRVKNTPGRPAARMGGLAATALGATLVLGGFAGLTAAPASASDCAIDAVSCIFTTSPTVAQQLNPDGHVDYYSSLLVNVQVAIPEVAEPGQTYQLDLPPGAGFYFLAFSGLELKNTEGTVLGTVTGSGEHATLTLSNAVATLSDAVGSMTLTVQATRGPVGSTPRLETLDLSVNGTSIGPDEEYTIAVVPPPVTSVASNIISLGGDELGINTTLFIFEPGMDVASTKASFTALTEGSLPICDVEGFLAFYQPLDANGDSLPPLYRAAQVDSCDPNTGIITMSIPAGANIPANAAGVSFTPSWSVDRPSFAYEFEATGTYTQNGQELSKTGRVTQVSGSLVGAGDGQLRPARIITEKDARSTAPVSVGDTVTYDVTVTSDEELRTAYDVVTTDTLPAGMEFVSATGGGVHSGGVITWPATDILAGEALSYTIEAKVTSIPDGVTTLVNLVTATGRNIECEGDPATASDCEDDATVPVATPGMTMDKQLASQEDTNSNGVLGDAGDTNNYAFLLTNNGSKILTTITLTDDLLGIDGHECLTAPLAIGASVLCEGEFPYVITDADAEAGEVHNVATATTPGLPPVTDEVITPIPPVTPGFEFDKELASQTDTNGNGVTGDAGDTNHYSFRLTNTGNTTLSSIKLEDKLLGVSDKECLTAPLVAGESVLCEGEYPYVITAADVTAGKVHNIATATTPGLPPLTDEVITPTPPAPVKPAPEPSKPAAPSQAKASGGALAQTGVETTALLAGSAVVVIAAGVAGLVISKRRRQGLEPVGTTQD